VESEKQTVAETDEGPANIELYCRTSEADGPLGKQLNVFTGDMKERAIELDPNQQEIDLNVLFFADNRVNNIWLRFDYSFTQNEGLTQDQVHSKSLSVQKLVRSQSPFRIDWQVMCKNPFVSSLRTYL
jgi:hypothetical protein